MKSSMYSLISLVNIIEKDTILILLWPAIHYCYFFTISIICASFYISKCYNRIIKRPIYLIYSINPIKKIENNFAAKQ